MLRSARILLIILASRWWYLGVAGLLFARALRRLTNGADEQALLVGVLTILLSFC